MEGEYTTKRRAVNPESTRRPHILVRGWIQLFRSEIWVSNLASGIQSGGQILYRYGSWSDHRESQFLVGICRATNTDATHTMLQHPQFLLKLLHGLKHKSMHSQLIRDPNIYTYRGWVISWGLVLITSVEDTRSRGHVWDTFWRLHKSEDKVWQSHFLTNKDTLKLGSHSKLRP